LVDPGGLGLLPRWLTNAEPRRANSPTNSTGDAHLGVSTLSFLKFAAPVLTLILGKIAAYGFMTHAAASLGAVQLAAHQIALSIFFFLTPFLEVLSQTAQAFVPQYAAPPPSVTDKRPWQKAGDALAARLLRYACAISAGAALFGGSMALIGTPLLTSDAAVREAVRPLAAPLAMGTLLCGPIGASEGVLLGRRQVGFLAGVYVATVALLTPALLAVKTRGGPVALVWTCFAAFQACRAALFSGYLWWPRNESATSS
jgi:Na+-driven multidrug efflux pump